MRTSLIALTFAAAAGLAACSAPADTASEAETTTTEVSAESGLYRDLGGEATGPVYRETKEDTLAVSGYDVVSYFIDEGVPVEGSEEFTVRYQGFDYRFASAANADAFIENPDKYAPAYGGYCAWAIGANDSLAPGNPNVYKIVDGKLYLNFSEQVAENWNKDIPGFIVKADANYPTHSADEHYQD